MQLPACTGHWIVMLSGMMPVQWHIVRCFIRFWNRLCDVDGGTSVTDACVDAQLDLMRRRKACWLKGWARAFAKLLPDCDVATRLECGQPLDEDNILHNIEQAYYSQLQGCGNPLEAQCPSRRTAFVFTIIHGQLGQQPGFLKWKLPTAIKRVWWQFCSASSDIPVHRLRRHQCKCRLQPDCVLNVPLRGWEMSNMCSWNVRLRIQLGWIMRMPCALGMVCLCSNLWIRTNMWTRWRTLWLM